MQTTTPDAQQWDQFVRTHPRTYFLQVSAWAELKCAYGWQAERVALVENHTIRAGAQLLFKPLPLKLGTMAYLPYGAYVTDEAQWPSLWGAIHDCARRHDAAFLKWEPGFYLSSAIPDFEVWGFQLSPQCIQPPRTILIDITAVDDMIQSRMNQSTRRNIRKAYKNDICYFEAAPHDVDSFTNLMTTTGERNDFGVHEAAYYRRMYDLLVPQDAALILAEHEGDILAGNFVMQSGKMAIYLEGASSNEKRNLMASYGVQWEAIQWAKRRGCSYYDMWGVPDEDADTLEAQFKQHSDGLWGVYRFKRGWGGDIVRTAGTWDFVYNRFIYTAYRTVLKIR